MLCHVFCFFNFLFRNTLPACQNCFFWAKTLWKKNLPDQYFYFSRQFLGNFFSSKGIICNGIISIFFTFENKVHNYNILAVTGDPTTSHPAVRLGGAVDVSCQPPRRTDLSLYSLLVSTLFWSRLSPLVSLYSLLISTLSTCLSALSASRLSTCLCILSSSLLVSRLNSPSLSLLDPRSILTLPTCYLVS